jgi:hypothetical protein
MPSHQVATREQWTAAYRDLRADRFDTNEGTKTLTELFDGRCRRPIVDPLVALG